MALAGAGSNTRLSESAYSGRRADLGSGWTIPADSFEAKPVSHQGWHFHSVFSCGSVPSFWFIVTSPALFNVLAPKGLFSLHQLLAFYPDH